MPQEAVAIGADHAGYEMKKALSAVLSDLGYRVIDFGTNDAESVDYPDFANSVSQTVRAGDAKYGVLCAAAVSACPLRQIAIPASEPRCAMMR